VSGAVLVTPAYEAEMVTGVDVVTALLVTVNVALVAPAATVTLVGTLAAPLSLESMTCAPPVGAGPLSVTVPVEVCAPPVTLVGFSVSEESVEEEAWGRTVSEAVLVTPAYDAEMVTGVDVVTALLVTVNVALVVPAATVTLAGTVAADELLERFTATPPLGADPLRVTVPIEEDPPVTLVGLSVTEESVGEEA
jgi:phosphohistidine swiveling domain-containing protein